MTWQQWPTTSPATAAFRDHVKFSDGCVKNRPLSWPSTMQTIGPFMQGKEQILHSTSNTKLDRHLRDMSCERAPSMSCLPYCGDDGGKLCYVHSKHSWWALLKFWWARLEFRSKIVGMKQQKLNHLWLFFIFMPTKIHILLNHRYLYELGSL